MQFSRHLTEIKVFQTYMVKKIKIRMSYKLFSVCFIVSEIITQNGEKMLEFLCYACNA